MTEAALDNGKTPKTSKDWDLRAVAPFVALALLLVLGAVANPNFIGIDNLLNVVTRSAFIAIIALGATYVITSGGLDLSVGAMVAFVASLMILFMNSGVIANPLVMLLAAMALAIAIGAACGLANGLITTIGRIEPFIATLGTMGIYRGLTTAVAGWRDHAAQPGNPDALSPGLFRQCDRCAGAGHCHLRHCRHRRFRALSYPLRQASDGGGFQRGCGALLRYLGRSRPHDCLCGSGALRRRCRPALRAASCLHFGHYRHVVGVAGHHRRRRRRHGATGGVGRIWGTICGAFILEIVGNIMILSNFVSEYLIGAIQGAIIIIAMLVQRSLSRR